MRAYLVLAASIGLLGCIDYGGQAGTYCRADRDCDDELVCIAQACRSRTTPVPPTPVPDAGVDSGTDAGPPMDAGFDAGPEDAGTDAGTEDAGTDAGTEDAGTDAGTEDAGT